eukprot:3209403-Rhodomonas_salina.1
MVVLNVAFVVTISCETRSSWRVAVRNALSRYACHRARTVPKHHHFRVLASHRAYRSTTSTPSYTVRRRERWSQKDGPLRLLLQRCGGSLRRLLKDAARAMKTRVKKLALADENDRA